MLKMNLEKIERVPFEYESGKFVNYCGTLEYLIYWKALDEYVDFHKRENLKNFSKKYFSSFVAGQVFKMLFYLEKENKTAEFIESDLYYLEKVKKFAFDMLGKKPSKLLVIEPETFEIIIENFTKQLDYLRELENGKN